MANGEEVLEQPRIQTTPEGFGGIGGAILNLFGMQSERQRQEEVAKFFTDVQAAGSREKALEVVKNYSGRFKSADDIDTAFRAVDESYPEASREVRQITVYDKATGEQTPHLLRSGDVTTLSDPAEVERRFGPGMTLTKPDLETFYSAPDEKGRVRVLGKMPVSQRPEGAVTLPELTEQRRFGEQARKDREEGARQAKFEAWLDLAERRFLAAFERSGGSASERQITHGRQLLNDAARMSAIELGGKVLPDGTFAFDDSNRAAEWNKRLAAMQNLVETDPSILTRATGGVELHNRAAKLIPSPAETPRPTPTPKPKPKGIVEKVKDVFSGSEEEASRAPTKENAAIMNAVQKAGQKYEPEKYEYRMIDGKLYRRPKGGTGTKK